MYFLFGVSPLASLRQRRDMPSSEMYTVKTKGGKEVLFPAIPEFVVRVDTDTGVYIRPIPGFFEEDE